MKNVTDPIVDETGTIMLLIPEQKLRHLIFDEVEKAINKIAPQPKEYLSRKDVAGLLMVTLATVNNWVNNGHLKAKKVGSRVLFDRQDIEEALATKEIFKYKH